MFEEIKQLIQKNPVILFMKGSREKPFCGFSKMVVSILESYGIQFETVDVLMNPQLRNDLKSFSDWPTFPQLYICQDLIGGCDIVTEMYHNGELEKMIEDLVSQNLIQKVS
jgi:monothiol glutaredoxin